MSLSPSNSHSNGSAISLLTNFKWLRVVLIIFIGFILIRLASSFSSSIKSENHGLLLPPTETQFDLLKLDHPPRQFAEIKELRSASLKLSSLLPEYTPSVSVFKGIEDRCAWYSQANFAKDASFVTNVEGPPLDALAIANPLFMVFPRIWNTRIEGSPENHQLRTEPSLQSLTGSNTSLIATFDITSSVNSEHLDNPKITFSPIVFNAFDIGFEAIHYDAEKSSGVSASVQSKPVPSYTLLRCQFAGLSAVRRAW